VRRTECKRDETADDHKPLECASGEDLLVFFLLSCGANSNKDEGYKEDELKGTSQDDEGGYDDWWFVYERYKWYVTEEVAQNCTVVLAKNDIGV
jgi:hypothetical protein